MKSPEFPLRRIRSFVRRNSRMTAAQRDAFKKYSPQFGLQLENGVVDFKTIFQRDAKRVLEIGFGSGASLLAAAEAHPEYDFIGIETHQPGVGSLLLGIESKQLNNIRIYNADAVDVLKQCIPDASLNVIQIFFPDPWPKQRHHKRRLIQTDFVELLMKKLVLNGSLHLATDWKDYAVHMMKVLSAEKRLMNTAGECHFSERSELRPVITKFEQRGEKLGHDIFELHFKKY